MWMSTTCRAAACVRTPAFYYVNPQERKPQAQRDWLDLLQGRAHNVHKVDVCACKGGRTMSTKWTFVR